MISCVMRVLLDVATVTSRVESASVVSCPVVRWQALEGS